AGGGAGDRAGGGSLNLEVQDYEEGELMGGEDSEEERGSSDGRPRGPGGGCRSEGEWPRGGSRDDDNEDDDGGYGGAPAPGGRLAGRALQTERRQGRALQGNQQQQQQQQGGGSYQQSYGRQEQQQQQQQVRKQRSQRQLNMLQGCTGSTEDVRGDGLCGLWAAAAGKEGSPEAGSPLQVG
ncbi:hypothetical protein DUNSADRAFT_1137, partial [Dunaliella salina]